MNIAITGEGIVSAIGLNKQKVLQALQEGRTGIGEMKYLQSIHHELPVGEVDLSNEQMKKMLGIPSEQMMSRTSLLGMLAIDQALKDAYVDVASLRARKADGNLCVSCSYRVRQWAVWTSLNCASTSWRNRKALSSCSIMIAEIVRD